jgi:uncharacterized membrane protein YhaH (DUF805 family)
MTNWFISINGEQKGPYPTDQLRQLVSDGFVSRDAYVWREGMANWMPLNQVRVSDDPVGVTPVPQVAQAQVGSAQQQTSDAMDMSIGYRKPGYFSFYGRISRKTYWLTYVLLPIVVLALASIPLGVFGKGLHGQLDEMNAPPIMAASGLLIIVWLVLAIAGLSGIVKRLHDRGRTGWFYFIVLIPLVGPIWLLVELGFLRGTAGPNEYGQDPLS